MSNQASQLIAAYNAGRDPSRLALKLQAMRDNPFSFLRGTAHLFYRRMADAGIDPGGPSAWICGDLHLENFGTYAAGNGLTYFDINDFDECALAPCSWDVLRLATSILIAAPLYDIRRPAAVSFANQAIAAYLTELATGKPRWIERKTADGVIGALMESLRHRDSAKFVQKRTTSKRAEALDTTLPKMQPVSSKAEREAVRTFIESRMHGAGAAPAYEFLDVAYRIAGTGSLGITRYVVLASVTDEDGRKTLLDLKATLASAAAPVSPVAQPAWKDEADRVVAVQVFSQVLPPALLRAVKLGDRAFVFKELQPSSDRLDLNEVAKHSEAFAATVGTMGALAAWSQMRAAGHLTAASTDPLMAYGRDKTAAKGLLQSAQQLEQATRDDWREYCAAFDAGAFADTMRHLDKSKGDEAA